jgi:hypothetical protein
MTATLHRINAATTDAIALLKADHDALGHLFSDYEKTHSVSDKKALVAEICATLSLHAQVAEEIFYPAVKAALKGTPLAAEASAAHAGVKSLVALVEGGEPDGKLYDAKVKALAEHVKRHIKEEQKEVFVRARASSLDMDELGARMAARTDDLRARRS